MQKCSNSPLRNPHGAVIATFVAILIIFATEAAFAEGPPNLHSASWEELAKEFHRELVDDQHVVTVKTIEDALDLPSVRTLSEGGNRMLWQAMIHHSNPDVSTLGFLCIRRNSGRPEPFSALIVIGHAARMDSTAAWLATEDLMKADWSKVKAHEITAALVSAEEAAANAEFPLFNLSLMVELIPKDVLEAWVLSDEYHSPAVNARVAGAAMGSVVAESKSQGKQLPRKLFERFAELQMVSGYGRLVYVAWSDPSSPNFDMSMKSVLADDELTEADISELLINHGEYIKENWKRFAPNQSPARRQQLKERLKIPSDAK